MDQHGTTHLYRLALYEVAVFWGSGVPTSKRGGVLDLDNSGTARRGMLTCKITSDVSSSGQTETMGQSSSLQLRIPATLLADH